MSETNEMDELLRAALRGRPEAVGGLRGEALALAAIERAHLADGRAARLARVARWMRITSVAAGIMLVAALGVGAYWFGMADSGMASASTVATAADSTGIGGSATVDWEAVGGMLLGGVVVGLAVKMVMGTERVGMGAGYGMG